MAPQLLTGAVKNVEVSFNRSHKPKDCSTECGFPRSIGADDTDKLTGVDGERDILERNVAWKSERGVVEPNDRLVAV
jgi:hypothetical protein